MTKSHNHDMTAKITKSIMAYVTTLIEGSEDAAFLRESWGSAEHVAAVQKLLETTSSKPKTKDPEKPKRAKSSYIFYCANERGTVKEEMPTAKPTEVTKELGRRWKLLKASEEPDDTERYERYTKAAEEDKQRYQMEIDAYVEPTGGETQVTTGVGKSRKSSGGAEKAKRRRTAYYFYGQENRVTIKEELGEGTKGPEVTTELARRWKELKGDPERKEEYTKYVDLSAADTGSGDTASRADAPKKAKKTATKPAVPVSDDDGLLPSTALDNDDNDDIIEELTEKPKVKPAVKPKTDAPEKVKKTAAKPAVPVSDDDNDDNDDIEAILEELTEKPKVKPAVKPKTGAKVTGYRKFCNTTRTLVKTQNPDMEAAEVTAELGRQWKAFTQDQKDLWN